MTRPNIIRADTIDLQDQSAPSAQDHTRQPTHPAAIGAGPPAPHQAEALREVAAEEYDEQQRSPRVSTDWQSGDDHEYDDSKDKPSAATNGKLHQQDALAIAQNGGHTGSTAEDADMADAEGDDSLDDDDMMDKISSSPSIDDGGYSLPKLWPARVDSLSSGDSSPWSSSQLGNGPSSPYVTTPVHFPALLPSPSQQPGRKLLRSGIILPPPSEVLESMDSSSDFSSTYDDERRDTLTPLLYGEQGTWVESYDDDFEANATDERFARQGDFDLERSFDSSFDDGALMTIPYESSSEEDDEEFLYTDSRFIDSGWGGECLQESEDIDFEFVYALHTFVATVEGQANATKGDTMVLLDDSNSYWWLVRVVKDSSIGYLPAEHIETPTERLARLNKHRNMDLTLPMLNDPMEKTQNPLKKALRRRTTKTVVFTSTTYVEASDVDYSSSEDEGAENLPKEKQAEPRAKVKEDEIATIEPDSEKAEARDIRPSDEILQPADGVTTSSSEIVRTSDELFEGRSEGTGKSRNGTVRNTDSFFRDDTVETRKITITPNLLRDDSSTSTRTSNDSREIRQRPSLDKMEKDTIDKKDDKKKKDKKPGMLSGLFKRKDRKSKTQDDDIDELMYGKKGPGEEAGTSPVPSRDSDEIVQPEELASRTISNSPPKSGKLQKQPRGDVSVVKPIGLAVEPNSTETQQIPPPERAAPVATVVEPSLRLVQPDGPQASVSQPQQSRMRVQETNRGPTNIQNSHEEQKSGGTFAKILRARSASGSDPKPEKLKKATERLDLEDSDTSPDVSPIEGPRNGFSQGPVRPIPGAFPESYITTAGEQSNPNERLSESPVQVSLTETSNPPALMIDSSSQEEQSSPVSSPSPELIDVDELHGKKSSDIGSSTPTSTSTWNDAHLRTFFDDDTDVKDLLMVVYDKSGVVPAGPDHPITGHMFKAENAKLADITNRLDVMLGDWLARKANAAR